MWPGLLGSLTAVACWQGAVQSGTTRKADMLTTAWTEQMRASARARWARVGGGEQRVLETMPSDAVDESVGGFKGRPFANSEAVGLIPPAAPTPLFSCLNERSCWVEWEQGQERSGSAGRAGMVGPRKAVSASWDQGQGRGENSREGRYRAARIKEREGRTQEEMSCEERKRSDSRAGRQGRALCLHFRAGLPSQRQNKSMSPHNKQ